MAILQTDLDQLMNQAKVTLVGSSSDGLKGAFYDVVSEFLNDSSSWTEDVPVNAVTTSLQYTLAVSEGQIIRLVGVCDSQRGFIPALMPEIGELVLKSAPNTATTYTAQVVKNVALPTTKDMVPIAPAWLLPVWHLGLLDGLLGKMMLQPSKSYTNKESAGYHLRRFRDAISRARVAKLRANTNGATAWRFPQSFRSDSQQGGVSGFGGTDRSF